MEMPPIRYTHASDGTRIAYAIIPGASPPWLHVYTPGAPTIEQDITVPARRGFIENLAAGRKTVLYDPRGCGLSGPLVGGASIDNLVDDVAAVSAAVGEPLDVVALGVGALVAIACAGGRGAEWRSMVLSAPVARFAGSYQDTGHAIWRESTYREFLRNATRFSMDVTAEETDQIVSRWEETVPETSALAYRTAVLGLDVLDTARRIAIPALIATGGPRIEASSEVADAVRGATLALLSSVVHRPQLGTDLRVLWERHIRPQLVDGAQGDGAAPNGDHITARERDILRRLATGQSNAQIATELAMSSRTVERHVQNTYNKLGVHNRVEAANWATRNGGR